MIDWKKYVLAAILLIVGCKSPAPQFAVLPDTITLIVSNKTLWMGESVEQYANNNRPQYKIISVKFLGIADDPECYYEVKMILRGKSND